MSKRIGLLFLQNNPEFGGGGAFSLNIQVIFYWFRSIGYSFCSLAAFFYIGFGHASTEGREWGRRACKIRRQMVDLSDI